MSEKNVLLEMDQRVAYVTLNRPDRRNAFDDTVIDRLSDAFSEFKQRDDLVALVLRGNGPCFSAGADLDWMERAAEASKDENYEDAKNLAEMLYQLYTFPAPTVACVHGAAFGGGLGLVACCDIALSYGDTTFALSEVKLGLIPATISPYVLSAMGGRQAKRYMLTAETFDGNRAKELGLIHEVIRDGEQMEDRCSSVLSSLRTNGPRAMREAKQLCRDFGGPEIDPEVLDETAERIAETRASEEAREGVRAFLEDRAPGWVPEEQP